MIILLQYNDLLKNFNQLDYHIDVNNFLDKDNTLIKLKKIIENYNQESICIFKKINEINKDSIVLKYIKTSKCKKKS